MGFKRTSPRPTKPTDAKKQQDIGQKYDVCATALATDGRAVARLPDGSVVFVTNLLPTEEATIAVSSKKSTYQNAHVVKYIKKSPLRAEPPCPYTEHCGGCQIQHLDPAAQTVEKSGWLFETLKRIGKWKPIAFQAAQENLRLIFLKTRAYRRRITIHFDGSTLGFYQTKTNHIVAIDRCLISRPALNALLTTLKHKLPAIWEETTQHFQLSALHARLEMTEGLEGRVCLSCHVTHSEQRKKEPVIAVATIEQKLHKLLDIPADQWVHIKHPVIKKCRLHKESFLQPHIDCLESYHHHMTHCLDTFFKACRAKFGPHIPTIHSWDLYAGSGMFSLIPYLCAQKYALKGQYHAVEGSSDAISSLQVNLKQAPIQTHHEDVHQFIDKAFAASKDPTQVAEKRISVFICDPPRSGMGILTMQRLVELCPGTSCVLYLACDAASFARDCHILLEGGFQNKGLFLFDAFGQTSQYEVLGFFVKDVVL